ncbi:MAG: thioredoxin [Candidatus Latescibacterota bacterium]|nr:thioredoxin [Candidatus Latescibacterota bacterium]
MELNTTPGNVIDVDSSNFEQVVLQGSQGKVVVVDFWAEWCEPCKTLGPVLEEIVSELGPGVLLAKVDVDSNQDLARALRVQSIPAIKIIKDGQLVDEFTGALPREQVEEMLRRHVPEAPPNAAEEMANLVDSARQRMDSGDLAGAGQLFHQALEEDEENGGALLGLARICLLQGGDEEEVREWVGKIEEGTTEWEQGKALLTHTEFVRQCHDAGGRAACAERAQVNPNDPEAQYLLGCCAAMEGDYDTALVAWFGVVEKDRNFRNGAAKDAMVSVFHLLGRQHPAVGDYPQRLYRTLY